MRGSFEFPLWKHKCERKWVWKYMCGRMYTVMGACARMTCKGDLTPDIDWSLFHLASNACRLGKRTSLHPLFRVRQPRGCGRRTLFRLTHMHALLLAVKRFVHHELNK